jgi:FAD:protein FMN transferase
MGAPELVPFMSILHRRRFLQISAAACASLATGAAASLPFKLYHWKGTAMGAGASITLAHPDAEQIVTDCLAEIDRLEGIFSLFRRDSALSRLNAAGSLNHPPFELLALFDICGAVHAATGGLFDPTVQPLWATYAQSHASGDAPSPAALAAALERVGWKHLRYEPERIAFARPGMALTLNGIAQGYVADRLADQLAARGLTDILVNTGEFRALGGRPDGEPWPIGLDDDRQVAAGGIELRDRALATSSPRGTVFDAGGKVGHILHPRTGMPASSHWQLISVTGPSAAVADGLTTAMCLMSREMMDAALGQFPETALAHLS